MSRASTIDKLPVTVRRELDRRLIDGGFCNYTELEGELRARGFTKVSKSGLHRYGQNLRRLVQIGNAAEQLRLAGVDADLAAELTGAATLVVVVDRRNGRARIVNVAAGAAEVIKQLKAWGRA